MKKSFKFAFSLIELSIVILVIGLLVLGITQGSRIIKEARVKSARSLTTSSPVASSADLAFWFETTLEKSFNDSERTNNGAIGTWRNINPQSSSPLDVEQSSTSSKPLYIDNYTNSLPALKFDGVDDFLQRANVQSSELTKSGDQITVFIVQKYNGSSHSGSAIYWENVIGNRFNLHAPWANGDMYFDFGYSATGVNRITYAIPASYYNKTNIISGVRRPGGVGRLRINGVQYGQSNVLTATLNSATSTLNIARYTTLPSDHFYQNSYINEVIIYRRGLSDSEIVSIETYLSNKWGVALRGL